MNENHGQMRGNGGMAANGAWWSPSWWDAPLLAAALFVLGGYLFLLWRARGQRGAPDEKAAFAFIAGLTIVFIGVSSPFIFLRVGSHLGYMLQLELLMSLAPPLLLLGLLPLVRFLPKRRFASRLLRLAFVAALTLPVWLGVIYAWHVPSLHMIGIMGPLSQLVYPLQLVSYVGAGLLFWWPMVRLAGRSGGMSLLGKLGYLALAQAGAALLAALLIFHPQLIYDHGPITQPLGLTGMVDQKVSRIAMMVVDMGVASTVAGWIVLREMGRSALQANSRRRLANVGDG